VLVDEHLVWEAHGKMDELESVQPVEGRKRTRSGRQRRGRQLVRLKTLAALDSRTHAAIKAKALISALESDLGGPEHVTVAERQIVQHAGVLGAVIEHQEALWLAGEEVDETALLAAVNCQRRLLETVGLQRRAKDIMTIDGYLGKGKPGGSAP
jgi:hypothetical protein